MTVQVAKSTVVSIELNQPASDPSRQEVPVGVQVLLLDVPLTAIETASSARVLSEELHHKMSRKTLERRLAANAVAGRVVIEHGGTGMDDKPWQRASVIPATVAAIRDAIDFNGWVRIVPNPQRADFERASDRHRIELSLDGIGFAPRRYWQRILQLNGYWPA